MQNLTLKIKRLSDAAKLPFHATSGAAAADLYALCERPVTIEPSKRAAIHTGISIELPCADYVALVFARSGNAVKKGVTLANSVGVIDSDYRGEIICTLVNHGDEPFTVNSGDRIAQLMITYALPFVCEECESLSETARGEGGFGSTGAR